MQTPLLVTGWPVPCGDNIPSAAPVSSPAQMSFTDMYKRWLFKHRLEAGTSPRHPHPAALPSFIADHQFWVPELTS